MKKQQIGKNSDLEKPPFPHFRVAPSPIGIGIFV